MNLSETVLAVMTREGFVSSIQLQFPNGAVLRTPDLLWLPRAEKEKVVRDLRELCQALGLPKFESLEKI